MVSYCVEYLNYQDYQWKILDEMWVYDINEAHTYRDWASHYRVPAGILVRVIEKKEEA